MEQKAFNRNLSPSTIRILKKAMVIYSLIKNKRIKKSYDYKNSNITDNDKLVLCLFLASLSSEGATRNIEEAMLDSGIRKEMIGQYLKIDINCVKNDFEPKLISTYNRYLKKIEGLLRQINNPDLSNYIDFSLLIPEKIIFRLMNIDPNYSNIIDYIYKLFGLIKQDQHVYEHCSFDAIAELNRLEKKHSFDAATESACFFSHSRPSTHSYNILDKYGIDLTKKSYATNPAIGREQEIENLQVGLAMPDSSVMIVGEAGIGKTAIVEGLAYQIQNHNVSAFFDNMQIIKIKTSSLLSGCCFRGDFEKRIETLMDELTKRPNIVLFLDEIHTVMGAGSSGEQNLDFANMLKPYIDRGQIKMIGATTEEEYKTFISRDEAFKRRFQKNVVYEPTNEVLEKILLGSLPKIQIACNVQCNFNNDEIEKIIHLIVISTRKEKRIKMDNENNPSLSLSILKKSFAFAIIEGNSILSIEHIAKSLLTCDRINHDIKESIVEELYGLYFNCLAPDDPIQIQKTKIMKKYL